MGEKNSNDISSESTHQIHSQNIRHTPGEGLYQRVSLRDKYLVYIGYF